jgi:uncharacterized radical SAM superfamily protein
MEKNHLKELLEKQYKVTYISNINYDNKTYVKTLKNSKNKIEYLYYEIDNDTIKEINDNDLIDYFKTIYEYPSSDIIY